MKESFCILDELNNISSLHEELTNQYFVDELTPLLDVSNELLDSLSLSDLDIPLSVFDLLED